MFKIIDLSAKHYNDSHEPFPPSIVLSEHKEGPERMAKLVERLGEQPAGFTKEDFPDQMGTAIDRVTCGTHTGTHVDAPFHFGPVVEGKKAKTIDEVPLEWCFGPGVLLDMRHIPAGEVITPSAMEVQLRKIGYKLKPGDIVILQTGCEKHWDVDTKTFMAMQSGLDSDGVDYLVDQGVRVIGIDAWSVDTAVVKVAQKFKKTGNSKDLWSAHMHGRKREYLHIEKMCNLDALPAPFGFYISAFPIKIKGGTAGWCRAVALIPEDGVMR